MQPTPMMPDTAPDASQDGTPTVVTITKSPDGTFSVSDKDVEMQGESQEAPQTASSVEEALQIAKSLLMGEQSEQDSFNAVFNNKQQRPDMASQSKPGMMR